MWNKVLNDPLFKKDDYSHGPLKLQEYVGEANINKWASLDITWTKIGIS